MPAGSYASRLDLLVATAMKTLPSREARQTLERLVARGHIRPALRIGQLRGVPYLLA
jgi:hypothetical protein